MRRKIAKKRRKILLRCGAKITNEHWIKCSWIRKQCGYSVDFNYKGYNFMCAGFDELDTYKMALDCLTDEEFLSKLKMGDKS